MWRVMLLPFSWLYGILSWIRNKAYDLGVFSSRQSRIPSICIGNLQAGGSGKTPMTSYLYSLLSPNFSTSILLRGYGRNSRGLRVADEESNSAEIGDEALWYYRNLKGVQVVVSESRRRGFRFLEKGNTGLVLLDDGLQHRSVKADINILLSEYSNPYYKDYPLPYGRMREYRTGDKRADFIIITKCPDELELMEKVEMIQEINPMDDQEVFFTGLRAVLPKSIKGQKAFQADLSGGAVAVSGIASPSSFIKICKAWFKDIESLNFKDHHSYSENDITNILKLAGGNRIILCTAKDAVKFMEEPLFSLIPEDRFYFVEVNPYFLFDEEKRFESQIRNKLKNRKVIAE